MEKLLALQVKGSAGWARCVSLCFLLTRVMHTACVISTAKLAN